jgi:hypothetical protein
MNWKFNGYMPMQSTVNPKPPHPPTSGSNAQKDTETHTYRTCRACLARIVGFYNGVVYADPPYKGTNITGYKCEFDYAAFEKWLNEVPFMVIVSEYNAPAGCVEIASIKKHSTLAQGNKGGTNTEKLFVQERFYNEYLQKMGRLF